MRRGVVRVDRDDPDSAIGVLALERVDAPLPGEHVGAVVARLDEDENGRRAYSSSEWLRPSTPGRSKVGAVSMTLTECLLELLTAGDGRRATVGETVHAAGQPRRRLGAAGIDVVPVDRGWSAIRERRARRPRRASAPRASRSGSRSRARRAPRRRSAVASGCEGHSSQKRNSTSPDAHPCSPGRTTPTR